MSLFQSVERPYKRSWGYKKFHLWTAVSAHTWVLACSPDGLLCRLQTYLGRPWNYANKFFAIDKSLNVHLPLVLPLWTLTDRTTNALRWHRTCWRSQGHSHCTFCEVPMGNPLLLEISRNWRIFTNLPLSKLFTVDCLWRHCRGWMFIIHQVPSFGIFIPHFILFPIVFYSILFIFRKLSFLNDFRPMKLYIPYLYHDINNFHEISL